MEQDFKYFNWRLQILQLKCSNTGQAQSQLNFNSSSASNQLNLKSNYWAWHYSAQACWTFSQLWEITMSFGIYWLSLTKIFKLTKFLSSTSFWKFIKYNNSKHKMEGNNACGDLWSAPHIVSWVSVWIFLSRPHNLSSWLRSIAL